MGRSFRIVLSLAGRVSSLLLVSILSSAADRPSLFEDANRLYEQGKYTEASSLYENIIQGGGRSPAIFFNLGNAYFKQGEIGRALLNFRRAESLAPRDPDIQANIRFTRERVSNSVSALPGVLQRLRYFTSDEIAMFTGILFWIWAALYCLRRLRPALRPTLRLSQAIAGLLLASSLLLLVSASLARERVAIVTSRQATVHLGPLPESQPAFTAADGTELRLLSDRPGWLQVSDRSGRTGWIASTNAAVL